MLKRNLIVRSRASYCCWQPKTKIKIQQNTTGFISPFVIIVVFVALAGIFYIYSINSSAVKGYKIKEIEKNISQLKEENEKLKIREAELQSLYYIEEESKKLNMTELKDVSYIEETGPIAFRINY